MKKILILLFVTGLFAACNNDKGKNAQNTTDREQDDYNDRANSKNDSDKNARKTDYTDNKGTNSDDGKNSNDNNSGRNPDNRNNNDSWGGDHANRGWSSKDVREFVDTCIKEAEKGFSRSKATSYCTCMQVKLEKLYPDSKDVESVDFQTASMKRMVQDCLAGNQE
jgi:hypothetical protein